MTEETKRYMKKAEHALEVAKELKKGGYIPDAASKVYYAMFYAAQALLKNEGIDIVSSDDVEGNLFEQVEKAIELLRAKYLLSEIHFEGIYRKETMEYPEGGITGSDNKCCDTQGLHWSPYTVENLSRQADIVERGRTAERNCDRGFEKAPSFQAEERASGRCIFQGRLNRNMGERNPQNSAGLYSRRAA